MMTQKTIPFKPHLIKKMKNQIYNKLKRKKDLKTFLKKFNLKNMKNFTIDYLMT